MGAVAGAEAGAAPQQPALGFEKKYSTYMMCAVFGGLFGAHHFYTGNIGKGLLYLFTIGLLGFGWFKDVINSRRDFNREMAAQGILSTRGRS